MLDKIDPFISGQAHFLPQTTIIKQNNHVCYVLHLQRAAAFQAERAHVHVLSGVE
jgi:hypothetical protein